MNKPENRGTQSNALNLTQKFAQLPMALWWLIGFNLVGRIIWILYMHPQQLADFDWYFTHAIALAHGHGYVDQGKPTAYWPIGWPVILAVVIRIFGSHVIPGLIANAVFSTLIVVVVYFLTLRILGADTPSIGGRGWAASLENGELGGEKTWSVHRIAFTAALAYSLLPSQIEWNAILGSEESFALMLGVSLYIYALLIRRSNSDPWLWRTVAAGIIFGLAAIIRPIGLLFPVFLAAYEFWVNRRGILQALLRGVTFGVSMLIGIAPVTIRNVIAMHHFVLVSTNGGVNLWQGTKINGGYFWTWNPYKNPLLKVYNNEILKNKVGEHVALTYILHHPIKTFINGLYKVFDLYKVDTNAVWYTFHVQYPHSKAILYTFDIVDTLAYWFMMLAVIVAILILTIRTSRCQQLLSLLFPATAAADAPQIVSYMRRAVGFLLTFVVYNTLLFFFFPAWDRFRYPLMPLFAVLFAIGWPALWSLRPRKRALNGKS